MSAADVIAIIVVRTVVLSVAGISQLDAAIVVLELLGWAEVEDGGAALVPLLCTCLRALAAEVVAAPEATDALPNDAAAADSPAAEAGSDDVDAATDALSK